MIRRYQIVAFLLALLLTGVTACKKVNSGTNDATATRPPLQITPATLSQLRWIEGSWRGTGGGVPPFYERYKFENESTLAVETFADETLTKVTDVSRFELKDGKFGHSDGKSGAVATVLDINSITFDPVGKGNSFRWQRESGNSWKAILTWNENGVAKERVYNMERWPAATR